MKQWRHSKSFVISWYALLLIWIIMPIYLSIPSIITILFIMFSALGACVNHIKYIKRSKRPYVKIIDLNK